MFAKLRGFLSGPQVPAASGSDVAATTAAPAQAPAPAKVRLKEKLCVSVL